MVIFFTLNRPLCYEVLPVINIETFIVLNSPWSEMMMYDPHSARLRSLNMYEKSSNLMMLYLSQTQYTLGCLSEEIQQSALCKSHKTWIKLCMLITCGQYWCCISCRIGSHGFQPLCVEMLTMWKPLDREQITEVCYQEDKITTPLGAFSFCFVHCGS